jgi:hypothetical protein
MIEARTHVVGDIVEYAFSKDVFRHASGFCSERSHSTTMSTPSSVYGTLNLTIGIRAVRRTVSTSVKPASESLVARFDMASTPFDSLVKSAVDDGT